MFRRLTLGSLEMMKADITELLHLLVQVLSPNHPTYWPYLSVTCAFSQSVTPYLVSAAVVCLTPFF